MQGEDRVRLESIDSEAARISSYDTDPKSPASLMSLRAEIDALYRQADLVITKY